jgi:hypothetical protein
MCGLPLPTERTHPPTHRRGEGPGGRGTGAVVGEGERQGEGGRREEEGTAYQIPQVALRAERTKESVRELITKGHL